MTGAHVEVTLDGDVVVAALSGDVDLADTAAVASELRHAVGNDAPGLVADLSAVRYVDSAGIQLLFELTRVLEAARQTFAVVVAPESPIRTLVDLTGLAQAAAVCPTRAEAVAAVRAGAGRRY